MDRVLIINASPRAPKSNSKRYAQLFSKHYAGQTEYVNLTGKNHEELCGKLEEVPQLLLVFPLYADALPVTLLHFLKTLESHPPKKRPVVSVLINCGFYEYQQNHIAVQMLQLFCRQHAYPFGAVLEIGSGEAILDSPFRGFAEGKIKKLAKSIGMGRYQSFHVTMPIPRKLFARASTQYWIKYGGRFGVSKEQMQTMEIEAGE